MWSFFRNVGNMIYLWQKCNKEQMELTSDSVGPPSPKTKISGIISDGSGVFIYQITFPYEPVHLGEDIY